MALKGAFIGFTFNGHHSSEMGIIRVSDGNRFSENLFPSIQDKIVPIPGNDGSFYFGSQYVQKTISIKIAFDRLTEYQFQNLKRWLSEKKLTPLIFDEEPYKAYYAKINGQPSLKYICFDEDLKKGKGLERIYKGEGNLSFVIPAGVAYNFYNYRTEIPSKDLKNYNECEVILSSDGSLTYPLPKNNLSKLQNCGDIPCNYKIFLSNFSEPLNITISDLDYNINIEVQNLKLKSLGGIKDEGICFNSKTYSLQGYYVSKEDKKIIFSGNLYNEYLIKSDFKKIPLGEVKILINDKKIENLNYTFKEITQPTASIKIELRYEYY